MKLSTYTYIILLTLLPAAAGCGTGIEVTQKVTSSDVKRELGPQSPEQKLLADVAPQPLGEWTPGKRFYVTDDKIKLLLGNTAPAEPLAGSEIVYTGKSERITATGDTVTDLTFRSAGGHQIVYPAPMSESRLAAIGRVEIPFTAEMSLVDECRSRLAGNTYYVLVADQYTPAGANSRRRKYVPVTVKNVVPGNSIYPVAVIFTENDVNPATESMLYLNPGTTASQRTFAQLFSLDNPRLRYPHITDATWGCIVNNRVEPDMTREECRLALGAPVTVDSGPAGGYIVEIWTYDNGVYLRFEDGLLKSYRR